MATWAKICIGFALFAFGVANIACVPSATEGVPSAARFRMIFYVVLFVLPGIMELKAGVASLLLSFKRRNLQ